MNRNKLLIFASPVIIFTAATLFSLRPITSDFKSFNSEVKKYQVVDRSGKPLNITYQNQWNYSDFAALHDIPEFIQKAIIFSEDKKFNEHSGVDWEARFAALYQNVKAGDTVRGASTITEQVVKMLHKRPRNLWSRWLEGIEAHSLESSSTKPAILEFYLNQVPYASNRRGVVQAARYYFDRDLSTLSKKEMLALAVLPRSPSRLDLYKDPRKIEKSLLRLAADMQKAGLLSAGDLEQVREEKFVLKSSPLPVEASNFINFISRQSGFDLQENKKIATTLDANLQKAVQGIIDQRLKGLAKKNVGNAGALVVDNETREIIAWVVGGSTNDETQYGKIDAVTAPRQPGSSLKPFLYTAALDKGWTAATMIDDSPYSEAIGAGLHNFKNYSYTFYGKITLREALGNSLNIPALKTLRYVGVENYLEYLHKLGFVSLNKDAQFYNEGLALGNGEVTLFEMVQAYVTLANRGVYKPLVGLLKVENHERPKQVFTGEAASLVGNILSDPWARRLEFGGGSVLNLPIQTAVKTGTSTDYRDAWAIGYNYKYTVGVWMGNLDQKPMNDVTGSTGPALALRGIFSELNKNTETKRLYLSPRLVLKDICIKGDNEECTPRSEYFIPGTDYVEERTQEVQTARIVRPSNGLNMAIDPRIPLEKQGFEFAIDGIADNAEVIWVLNGEEIGRSIGGKYMWALSRGKHVLEAEILENGNSTRLEKVSFWVK